MRKRRILNRRFFWVWAEFKFKISHFVLSPPNLKGSIRDTFKFIFPAINWMTILLFQILSVLE